MSKSSEVIKNINKILVKEAQEVNFKNKLTKDKEKVDAWGDSKKLDRFDDEKTGDTFYIDKDGNVVAAYSSKDKQLMTDVDKEELDRDLRD